MSAIDIENREEENDSWSSL